MEYKIVEKDTFTVLGTSKKLEYETAMIEIPELWTEHYQTGRNKIVNGMYGINIDESMEYKEFEYIIADDYQEGHEVPAGFALKTIPAFTWAIFSCIGPMPGAMQDVQQKIFFEWLPNNNDYEIAAGYNIELYREPSQYPNGMQDEEYYSEIWIPVKKKN